MSTADGKQKRKYSGGRGSSGYRHEVGKGFVVRICEPLVLLAGARPRGLGNAVPLTAACSQSSQNKRPREGEGRGGGGRQWVGRRVDMHQLKASRAIFITCEVSRRRDPTRPSCTRQPAFGTAAQSFLELTGAVTRSCARGQVTKETRAAQELLSILERVGRPSGVHRLPSM
jgi:hypothetical protein